MKNKTHSESTLSKNLAQPYKETLILSPQDDLELMHKLTTIATNAKHSSKPSVVIVAKNLQHANILKKKTVIFDKHINLKFSIEKKVVRLIIALSLLLTIALIVYTKILLMKVN